MPLSFPKSRGAIRELTGSCEGLFRQPQWLNSFGAWEVHKETAVIVSSLYICGLTQCTISNHLAPAMILIWPCSLCGTLLSQGNGFDFSCFECSSDSRWWEGRWCWVLDWYHKWTWFLLTSWFFECISRLQEVRSSITASVCVCVGGGVHLFGIS